MLTDNPLMQVILFTVLQSPGVGSVALNTVTVELYPTKLRAMAICIALCCGRLGSVAGSNMVAYLLQENCELTFYLCGSTLIGNVHLFVKFSSVSLLKDSIFFLFSLISGWCTNIFHSEHSPKGHQI